MDVSAVNIGLDYDWNKTDYRLNPRKGTEIKFTGSVGMKNIKRNNDILNIRTLSSIMQVCTIQKEILPVQNKTERRTLFSAGQAAAFKAAFHAGVFYSPNIFRNELFQIGGYKLLCVDSAKRAFMPPSMGAYGGVPVPAGVELIHVHVHRWWLGTQQIPIAEPDEQLYRRRIGLALKPVLDC